MGTTRRIVMFNRVTPDGYFAGHDGGLDWTVTDDELDKEATQSMPSFNTFLFGRRTYELFQGFWPHAADESPTAPDPHHSARRSKEIRAMAVALNEGTKLVFSRTLNEATWKNSRLLRGIDPAEIEALKAQPGGDIIILGSGSIVSQLTRHGLIDEYQFIVSPVLLGNGRPLIAEVSSRLKLELLQARDYTSGNVLLRYARAS